MFVDQCVPGGDGDETGRRSQNRRRSANYDVCTYGYFASVEDGSDVVSVASAVMLIKEEVIVDFDINVLGSCRRSR